MGKILKRMITVDDQVEMCLRCISVRIRSTDSSKRKTYLEMKANLSPCAIYILANKLCTRICKTSHIQEFAYLPTTCALRLGDGLG